MSRIYALAFVLIWTPAARAAVNIQCFGAASADRLPAFSSAPPPSPAPWLKDNEPADGTWYIPFFSIDTSASSAASTFWSVRNEGDAGTIANVTAQYFDTRATNPPQATRRFALIPDQIAQNDVRAVEGDLAVDSDRIARGFIRVMSRTDEPISVDVFRIDAANDFATGIPAFVFPDDFCTDWMVRFLSFGGDSGSVMTAFVFGPQGLRFSDPPTLVTQAYDQQGSPLTSCDVRTDEWAFEIPVLELVNAAASFGSVEVVVNSSGGLGGLVSVVHNAQGRFSVGVEGICKDGL